jgi:hypothetical protein
MTRPPLARFGPPENSKYSIGITRKPATVVLTTLGDLLLATAASEWNSILQNLLKGENIQTALNNARWKYLGNPNVTIRSAKEKRSVKYIDVT